VGLQAQGVDPAGWGVRYLAAISRLPRSSRPGASRPRSCLHARQLDSRRDLIPTAPSCSSIFGGGDSWGPPRLRKRLSPCVGSLYLGDILERWIPASSHQRLVAVLTPSAISDSISGRSRRYAALSPDRAAPLPRGPLLRQPRPLRNATLLATTLTALRVPQPLRASPSGAEGPPRSSHFAPSRPYCFADPRGAGLHLGAAIPLPSAWARRSASASSPSAATQIPRQALRQGCHRCLAVQPFSRRASSARSHPRRRVFPQHPHRIEMFRELGSPAWDTTLCSRPGGCFPVPPR